MDNLREEIAKVQHLIWAHWMTYLFSVCVRNDDGSYTIPSEKVQLWTRQMETPYQELSVREKESDLEQADKVLAVLRKVSA